MPAISGIPPEYENVGAPRCDECRQTSMDEFENFYHCTEHGFDVCRVCAMVQAGILRKDNNGKFIIRGHNCPMTFVPNGDRHEAGQMCDGGEMLQANGLQPGAFDQAGLGACHSTARHNIPNKNQQYFFCEDCDTDVCICCAVILGSPQ